MEIRVAYNGKAARARFEDVSKRLVVSSPTGFRIHFNEKIGPQSPSVQLAGNEISWSGHSMVVASDPEALASAELFVQLINAARDVPTLSSNSSPAGAAEAAHVVPSRPAAETLAGRAFRIAANVETFAFVLLIAGLIGGIALAIQTEESCSSYSCSDSHPYVGMGVGLAIASAFQASVIIMVAAYIQARTTSSSST